MRALRNALPEAERAQASAEVVKKLLASNWARRDAQIAIYLAASSEMNVDELARELLARGARVFAPRDFSFARLLDLSAVSVEKNGVREPISDEECGADELDVIIAPGLAFDAKGGRLGQGGGWYDRVLPHGAVLPLTIGIGFDCQIVESVPRETHDQTLNAIITPTRCFDASGRLGLK